MENSIRPVPQGTSTASNSDQSDTVVNLPSYHIKSPDELFNALRMLWYNANKINVEMRYDTYIIRIPANLKEKE